MNSLPLIKKLKWLLEGTISVLYGHLAEENLKIISTYSLNSMPQEPFKTCDKLPYVEADYGIENIFKVLRVDAFHRLIYLQHSNNKNYGLRF